MKQLLFAAAIFLTATTLHAQSCNVSYDDATYWHREIINSDPERSRQEVQVRLTSGRVVTVPIINGYQPLITIYKLSDGGERHVLDYKEKRRWNPISSQRESARREVPTQYQEPVLAPVPRRTTDPVYVPFMRKPSSILVD